MTSEDGEKTRAIIQLLFVLYPLSRKHMLAVMNCLSQADPELVVSMLTYKLPEEKKFNERVGIVCTIANIIDRFRRINFDEENFRKEIMKEHDIQVHPETILVFYRDRGYNLFELLDALEPHDLPPQPSEEQENYYQTVYLLEMMRLLYGARSVKETEFPETRPKRDCLVPIAKKLATKLTRYHSLQQCSIVLSFLQDIVVDICE